MSVLEPPDDRALRPLNEWQVRALSLALRRWAERHPEPHRPLISFGGDRPVSASELARAVQPYPDGKEAYPDRRERYPDRRDQVRRQYLHMVQLVMLDVSFEEYLGSIERSGNPRFPPLRWLLELRDRVLPSWRKRQLLSTR